MVNINIKCSSASRIIGSFSSPIYKPFPTYRSLDGCKAPREPMWSVHSAQTYKTQWTTEQGDGDGRDGVGMLACSRLPRRSSSRGLNWTCVTNGRLRIMDSF